MTLYDGTTIDVAALMARQPRYEETRWQACTVCMFLVAYGEFDDGQSTAEDKWAAWKERGIDTRNMSVACDNCDDHGFTTDDCELCGGGYDNTLHNIIQLTPVH